MIYKTANGYKVGSGSCPFCDGSYLEPPGLEFVVWQPHFRECPVWLGFQEQITTAFKNFYEAAKTMCMAAIENGELEIGHDDEGDCD